MEDLLQLPIGLVRFPVELRVPPAFDPDEPSTWPSLEGRVELVAGKLLYLLPCGDMQSYVNVDVVGTIGAWARARPAFVVGANGAGMSLGGDVRGAEAAVWRRSDVSRYTGRFRRVAPILAAEVAGLGEGEVELRQKAGWYLGHGVEVVWLVLPQSREVVVLRNGGESRHRKSERLPGHASLPGLEPDVSDFFLQIDASPVERAIDR